MATEKENTEGTETTTTENTENTETTTENTEVLDEKEFKDRGLKIVQLKDSNRTMQVELDKLKAEKKQRENAEKVKLGKTDELLTESQKAIEERDAKIADIEQKLEERDARIQAIEEATKKELLSKLTKAQRDEWKDEPIETIRKFVKTLPVSSNGVDVDNGNASTKDVKLTEKEKKEAQVLGLTDEAYYEVQKTRKANMELKTNSQIKKV